MCSSSVHGCLKIRTGKHSRNLSFNQVFLLILSETLPSFGGFNEFCVYGSVKANMQNVNFINFMSNYRAVHSFINLFIHLFPVFGKGFLRYPISFFLKNLFIFLMQQTARTPPCSPLSPVYHICTRNLTSHSVFDLGQVAVLNYNTKGTVITSAICRFKPLAITNSKSTASFLGFKPKPSTGFEILWLKNGFAKLLDCGKS